MYIIKYYMTKQCDPPPWNDRAISMAYTAILWVHTIYISEWWWVLLVPGGSIISNIYLFVSTNLLYVNQAIGEFYILSETRKSFLKWKPKIFQQLPSHIRDMSSLAYHIRCIRTWILPTFPVSPYLMLQQNQTTFVSPTGQMESFIHASAHTVLSDKFL